MTSLSHDVQGSIQRKGSTARPCSHLAVADSLQDLGRQILGGAAEGLGGVVRGDGFLGEAEVSEARVAHLGVVVVGMVRNEG